MAGLIGDWAGFVVDCRAMEVASAVVGVMCERWPCVVDDEKGFLGWARDYLEQSRAS